MLKEIYKYGKSLDYNSGAFESSKANWEIFLSSRQNINPSIIELFNTVDVTDKKGVLKQKKVYGKEFFFPYTSKDTLAAGGLSKFLSDTIEKVFGCGEKENSKLSKEYFKQQISDSFTKTSNPTLKIILDFLNNDEQLNNVLELLKGVKSKVSDRIVFSVDYKYVHEEPSVKSYWEEKRREVVSELDKSSEKGMCLLTGEYGSLARTWKDLKRVVGANATGSKVCSCDKDAFSHYNKESTYNSPITIESEELLNRGFQTLIDKGRTVGDVKYIYWTETSRNVDPFEAVLNPSNEDVNALLDSVFSGDKGSVINLQDELFYMASLNGNGGRIIMRGWYEEPLSTIKNNIKSWFDDLSIYDSYNKTVKCCISLNQLLFSILVDGNWKTEHPKIRTDLIETAVKGKKMGQYILNLVVNRDLKEITQNNATSLPRLALLKMCVNKITNNKVDEKLIMKNETVAYLCGRLMGVLDSLHWSAMKDSSTLYRRIFSASMTPKSVIGELVNKSQVYIRIANTKCPGSGTNRSKEIKILVNKIDDMGGFPVTLNKNEQAEFCIGFHCERL